MSILGARLTNEPFAAAHVNSTNLVLFSNFCGRHKYKADLWFSRRPDEHRLTPYAHFSFWRKQHSLHYMHNFQEKYTKMVSHKFISPRDFKVNEAWAIVRANKKPIWIEANLYDCYVLMDMASTYIVGQILTPSDGQPSENEVEDLLQNAREMGKSWAKRLILVENGPTENMFAEKAKHHGMAVKHMPENALLPIIKPMRDSFAKFLNRKA